MILVDMSQVILGNIFGYTKDISEADENLIRHLTLNSLRMYKNKFKKYGDMILVFDSGDYWRKEEFPHYKGTRKLKQEEKKEMWSNLWNIVSMVRDELENNFPYKVMRVGRAEADDIIAYLAKKYHQTEDIMIVSSDKDFQQLQRYDNVHQYSPKNKSKVICTNPKEFLINHIIRGDSSDGIPNILSDDDTLMNPEKRQKRLTQKVLDSINEDLVFGELPKGHEDNWKRNQTLVDLDKVPDWVNDKIEKAWNEPIVGKRSKLFNYFIKHKLKNLMETIEEF
tara:strand:+ start:3417 stop:4259 length:843 start_codon:yes stop_codon:yes gene_type:complete